MSAFHRLLSVLRHRTSVVRRLTIPLAAFLFAAAMTAATTGWDFDTGISPEATRDLLVAPGFHSPPAGSWLRLRGLAASRVLDASGADTIPWPDAGPAPSLTERRAALSALRERGYRLVAILQWPAKSWTGGIRPGQLSQRLPLDLREATTRCRQLAEAYGDLIDYWEIENEPDISFVDENPETYSAFQKACYLGFAQGRPETRDRRPENQSSNLNPTMSADRGLNLPVSGLRSPVSAATSGRVLAAAFALPPGPYFESWIANDGLRYTDGFNYHYYGYAEDFTGVYQQFEEAVTRARAPTPADTTVFQTRFYPHDSGLKPQVVAGFAFTESETRDRRAALGARSLASEEPALRENQPDEYEIKPSVGAETDAHLGTDSRWLVSPGTSVRETSEGWEFTVTAPAPGPLRPAMAELPLPAGWTLGEGTSLAFEFRAASAILAEREAVSGKRSDSTQANEPRQNSRINYPTSSRLPLTPYPLPAASTRTLPVFLTEYGYGLLGKVARHTVEGREAQRAWFAAVQPQLETLGIDAAMAFVLMPYLEHDLNEFGLLVSPDGETVSGKRTAVSVESGPLPPTSSPLPQNANPLPLPAAYAASPALLTLLEAGTQKITPRDWPVATTAPSPVVIDFVAGSALKMSKTRRGYLLQADTAAGTLVLYNLGTEPVSGELSLEGSAWTLEDGTRSQLLRLAPNERRALALKIDLTDAPVFAVSVAAAKFVIAPHEVAESAPRARPSAVSPPPSVPLPPANPKLPVSGLRSQVSPFEVYLRTSNGNLYQTWPRLRAREDWQWYVETLASFTPAFYGRAFLPSALKDNKPVALVFFFRPGQYPVTYQVRHASVVDFVRPAPAEAAPAVSGKR